MPEQPQVSVIIPTHNRRASLLRTLEALGRQDFPPERMEVVVVADGCTDGTGPALEAFAPPYRLTVLSQSNLGPSGARNAGAAAASGTLLIFVDDDVEPRPGLVSGHLARHQAAPCQPFVVIGYYPTELTDRAGFYPASLTVWWEELFDTMAAPGHRFRYLDVFSGNLSMARRTFEEVGGFETALRCHEDYELGLRLIRHGAAFGFSRAAIGLHHETSDIHRSVRRKHEEGAADIWLARAYPDLVPDLPLSNSRIGAAQRLARFAAFRAPPLLRALRGLGHATTRIAEILGSRRLWRRACYLMLETGYWQGVAAACGSHEAFRRLVAAASKPELDPGRPGAIEIDLRHGIEAAEARLDAVRPAALVVRSGEAVVAISPSNAGTERLHGGHLRPMLAHRFSHPLAFAEGILALAARRAPEAGPPRGEPDPHPRPGPRCAVTGTVPGAAGSA